MITQVDLYNAVLKHLSENAVNEDDLDRLSDLMGDNSEEGRPILRKLTSSRYLLDKASEIMEKMAETIDPIIATGIYERINILKDDIDLFEDEILSELTDGNSKMPSDSYHGLRRSRRRDRINVFLVGAFSSGKTSFIGRLIDGLSGHISGAPSTALLVIHKNDTASRLVITYNREIPVKDREKMVPFLKKYDLYKDFKDKNESLVLKEDDDKVIDSLASGWGTDTILSFLQDANDFPGVFAKIVWNHRRPTKKKYTFLDFANLYDMPGFEGDSSHDPVIENIFREYRPDIILYLIDTQRGSPSEGEIPALSNLLQSVMRNDPLPVFCWVYQKPSSNFAFDIEKVDTGNEGFLFDEKYLREKKKSMTDFIREIVGAENFIQRKKQEISNEEELSEEQLEMLEKETKNAQKYIGLFNSDQEAYLLKSFILDARGPSDDTEIAQNAVSLGFQKYFYSIGTKYCEEAKTMLAARSKKALEVSQQEVMQYRPGNDNKSVSKNSFIKEKILDKIRDAHDDHSLDNARRIFSDALGIELPKRSAKKPGGIFTSSSRNFNDDGNDDDLAGYPFDLKATMKKMKEDISATVDGMLESIKLDTEKVSLDALVYVFWEKYQNDTSWQRLLFNVQAYHWLKASYEGLIAPQYISDIGSAMLISIERDIKRLTETSGSLPIITSIEEDF